MGMDREGATGRERECLDAVLMKSYHWLTDEQAKREN